jgi:HK97 family phage major capsid protein
MSLEQMKAVMAEMKDLSGKAATEQDEAKKAVLKDMIEGKKSEFAALEVAAKEEQEQAEREKLMAELEGKKNAADTSKKDQLVEIDGKSQHNATNHDLAHTRAFNQYFTAPKASEELRKIAGKKGDNFVDSMKPSHGEGILMPAWMRDYVAPQATATSDIEATLGKSLEEIHGKDVLVREASGTNSGGGSLVDVDYEATLFKTPNRLDDLMNRCWVKRSVGKEAQYPKLTQTTNEFGVAVTWGNAGATNGEGTAITESNPVFTRVDVGLERLSTLTQVSLREVRVNDVGLEGEIAWMFRGAASRAISQAILNGVTNAGTALANAPTGINTQAAITAGVGLVARQTADQVSYTDLVAMQFAVNDGVFGEGIYVVSSGPTGSMKYIAALDDSAGRPVYAPENTWGNGPGSVATLAGQPYIMTKASTNAGNTLGERGDVIYGNFSGYALPVDDTSFAIERSDEYAFNLGVVTYRMIAYVGGQPIGYDMFSLLGDDSGASSSSSS